MFTITLADGRKIENLRLNGNNFVSEEKIDESIFKDNLSTLTYTDGENEVVMHNAELIQQVHYDDGWYFCFRELSSKELALKAMEKTLKSNADSVTDIQIALAEVYELILGGTK